MDKPERLTAGDSHLLGCSDAVIRLTTHLELRTAALMLARQARQSLYLFSHDLEALIYNQMSFIEALIRVAHQHRTSSVKILVRDPSAAVKAGHRLIEVSQRFSSDITIRCLSEDYADHRETFLVADRIGVVYRDDYGRNQGMVCFSEARLAEKLCRLFNGAWERSRSASAFRRLDL